MHAYKYSTVPGRFLLASILVGMVLAVLPTAIVGKVTYLGWLIPLFCSLVVLVVKCRDIPQIFFPWIFWVLFVAIYGIFSPFENSFIRSVIISVPVIVGLAASSVLQSVDDLRPVKKYILCFSFVFLLVIFFRLVMASDEERFPVEAIGSVVFLYAFFQLARLERSKFLMAYALMFALFPLFASTRGPLFVSALVFIFVLPVLSYSKLLIKLVLFFGLIFIVFVLYQPLNEKMFFDGYGLYDALINPDLFRTSGRQLAWQLLIEKIPDNFYFGHGANASEEYLIVNYSEAFAHPHNDYLRFLFDYGLFGLFLFLFAVFSTCYALLRLRESGDIKAYWIRYVSILLFLPYLLLMAVDNIALYAAFFGCLHFYFIGTAAGLIKRGEGVCQAKV